MKSFYQFQEDASSQTQSAVSGSGSFKGGSDYRPGGTDQSFKKRPSTGLGGLAGRAAVLVLLQLLRVVLLEIEWGDQDLRKLLNP